MSQEAPYDNLRKWYLARLRNLAREKAKLADITPATLIASDNDAIKKLVAERAKDLVYSVVPDSTGKGLGFRAVFGIWFILQSAVLLIFIFAHGAAGFGTFANSTLLSLIPTRSISPDLLSKFAHVIFFLSPAILCFLLSRRSILKVGVEHAQSLVIGIGTVLTGIVLYLLFFQADSSFNVLDDAGILSVSSSWCFLFISSVAFYLRSVRLILSLGKSELRELIGKVGPAGKHSPTTTFFEIVHEAKDCVNEILQREQAIADYAEDVLINFDAECKILAVSPSVLKKWGYSNLELIGQDLRSYVFLDDREVFSSFLQNTKIQNHANFDLRVRKQDNSIIDISWHVEWSPGFGRYFATCADITDRKNLERARSFFMTQLTHDMRSPLTAIDLTLTALQDDAFGQLSKQAKNTVDKAQNSMRRVLELISEMLQSEKLKAGHDRIEVNKVSLTELLMDLVEELDSLSTKYGVTIKTKDQYPEVLADSALIYRVFCNLVSNAITFSSPGSHVDIDFSDNIDTVVVRITDQGPGIPSDYQQVIFERFGFGGNVRGDRVSTGIGLSICRDIVQAHGGIIGVDSKTGEGSSFWFTLKKSS